MYSMASLPAYLCNAASSESRPSQDHAQFLVDAALFHLGSLYQVVERSELAKHITRLYESEIYANSRESIIWRVQLFLLIAFGRMFTGRDASKYGPPGADDFVKGMKLMPDPVELFEDPIRGIEALCLASLYLLCADMRNAGYTLV